MTVAVKQRADRRCSDCANARVVGHLYASGRKIVHCAADYWPLTIEGSVPEEEAQNCELYDSMDEEVD